MKGSGLRFLLGGLAALVLCAFGGFWSGLTVSGVLAYLDAASGVMMLGLPLVMLATSWSPREMARAFRSAASREASEAELEDAEHFFKTAGRYVLAAALFSILIGVVAMLMFLEDRSRLGPNLAIALLSALYGAFLELAVCLPFESSARRRLIAFRNGRA